MNTPLVSICIPVFNTVKYVRQTIECVLAQQYSNIEIIVQDNASTDGTWELLEILLCNCPKIKIGRNQRNIGMSGNWNAAIKKAQGDYVMLLSADDLIEPEFISSCMDAFENGNIDFVSTHYWYLYPDESRQERGARITDTDRVYHDFAGEVLRINPFHINFTVFSQSLIRKMYRNDSLFSPYVTCDYDLFLRLGTSGARMKYLAKPLGYYRIHESNVSHNQTGLQWHGLLTIFGVFFPLAILYPKQYFITLINIKKRLIILLIKKLFNVLIFINLL